jgi:multidrug efflux pump subunit AcrA (membrane-fusion protein)
MEKEIIPREEAAVLGLTRYFTGRSCRNGHIADRYVNGGACAECVNGDKIITDAERETRVAERQQKLDWQRRRIEMAEERLKQRQEEQARRLELAEQRLKQRQEEQAERLELAQQRAQRQEKSALITDENRAVRGVSVAARSEMLKIKIAIPYYDLPAMKGFVHGLASVRIPGIRVIDVCPNLIPKFCAEPVFIYVFLVHPEDRALVFQAQDEFMNEMKGAERLEQIRINNERIIQQLNDEKDAEDNGDPGDTLENLMR